VNPITSGVAVLGAAFIQSLRLPLAGSQKNASFAAAFEQSPHGGLLVDATSLRLLGANEMMRRQLDVLEADLQNLTLDTLFEYDCPAEILKARLRDPDPKVPLRARQRRKDGRELELELVGYPVTSVRGNVLVYIAQDIGLKTRLEGRLLKKQEHLDQLAHLAHHDPLTGLPNRLSLTDQVRESLVAADQDRTRGKPPSFRAGKTLMGVSLSMNRGKKNARRLQNYRTHRAYYDARSRTRGCRAREKTAAFPAGVARAYDRYELSRASVQTKG